MRHKKKRRYIVYLIGIFLLITVIWFSSRNRYYSIIEIPLKDFINNVQLLLQKKTRESEINKIDLPLSEVKQTEIIELKELLNLKNILSDFTIEYASVINRNVSYFQENLTIDKGSKDGLTKDMAVITSLGLIGKLDKVGNTSSEVSLLTSVKNNYQVSVSIQSDILYHGVLNQYKRKMDCFLITGVSSSANVKIGDIVITSGLGGIFPSGIVVGKVVNSTNDSYGITKTIEVKSEQNFNGIHYVAIAKKEVKE